MDYPPGYVRVVAVAVGVVFDEQERVLLIQHPDRCHLWFPSGKIKDTNGEDIIRVLNVEDAAQFVVKLFTMGKEERETRRAATLREVYEEIAEEMHPQIVPPIDPPLIRRIHIKCVKDYDVIKLHNQQGDGTKYDKPVPSETVIMASQITLPPLWMEALQKAALAGDRRVCFAPKAEIVHGFCPVPLRQISPDVQRVLVRTGAYSP